MTGDVYISNHDIASHFLDGNEWGKGRGEARIESNTLSRSFREEKIFFFFSVKFFGRKDSKGNSIFHVRSGKRRNSGVGWTGIDRSLPPSPSPSKKPFVRNGFGGESLRVFA